jgi:class 3 adenylate cyclase
MTALSGARGQVRTYHSYRLLTSQEQHLVTHTATIVFCDIGRYSQTDDEQQLRLIRQFSADITHELYHRLSEPEPSVVLLPTGDGMAIVLLDRHETVDGQRKIEVFRLLDRLMNLALSNQWDSLKSGLRIGVHRGTVSVIRDINRQLNVCGYTVNYCQRVMDAAHLNQVLISEDACRLLMGEATVYDGEPFGKSAPVRFSPVVNIPAKHGLMLHVRVIFREGVEGWEATEPFPHGAIVGKKDRTKFIVDRFRELLNQPKRPLVIYEQSAFGTFGYPEKNRKSRNADQGDYSDLLLEQKGLLKELARQSRTTLYLMFRPVRVYSPRWRAARIKALSGCLKELSSGQNVKYAITDNYQGPNRLIVEGLFCIEGYKIHDTAGYALSFVKSGALEIQNAIAAFHEVYDRLSPATLDDLEALHKRFQDES